MWILTQWKLVLPVSTLCALLLMTSAWRTATAQRDLARAEKEIAVQDLANYKQVAKDAVLAVKDQSDRAVKEIKREHKTILESTKSNALKNYLATYGDCAPDQRPADGVQPGDSLHHGEAGSTEGIDGIPQSQRLFIEACATDAGITRLWREWAELNHLPVSKE